MKQTEQIVLMLTEEDVLLLQQLADHLGTTMSGAVEYAIQHLLNEIESNPSKYL